MFANNLLINKDMLISNKERVLMNNQIHLVLNFFASHFQSSDVSFSLVDYLFSYSPDIVIPSKGDLLPL